MWEGENYNPKGYVIKLNFFIECDKYNDHRGKNWKVGLRLSRWGEISQVGVCVPLHTMKPWLQRILLCNNEVQVMLIYIITAPS